VIAIDEDLILLNEVVTACGAGIVEHLDGSKARGARVGIETHVIDNSPPRLRCRACTWGCQRLDFNVRRVIPEIRVLDCQRAWRIPRLGEATVHSLDVCSADGYILRPVIAAH